MKWMCWYGRLNDDPDDRYCGGCGTRRPRVRRERLRGHTILKRVALLYAWLAISFSLWFMGFLAARAIIRAIA